LQFPQKQVEWGKSAEVNQLSIIGTNTPTEIKEKYAESQALEQKAKDLREEAIREAVAYQLRECDHGSPAKIEIMAWDADYCASSCSKPADTGFHVLTGWECELCGLFFARKGGTPGKVCYRCGQDMQKPRSTLPGHKGILTARCRDCGHTHEIRRI
jgi:hypothetical protein